MVAGDSAGWAVRLLDVVQSRHLAGGPIFQWELHGVEPEEMGEADRAEEVETLVVEPSIQAEPAEAEPQTEITYGFRIHLPLVME